MKLEVAVVLRDSLVVANPTCNDYTAFANRLDTPDLQPLMTYILLRAEMQGFRFKFRRTSHSFVSSLVYRFCFILC